LKNLMDNIPELRAYINGIDERIRASVVNQAEIVIKYEGYVEKENEIVSKLNRFEDIFLKDDFDYNSILSLSIEARQKLTKVKPRTLGQASRISGVSPSDISVLMVYLGR